MIIGLHNVEGNPELIVEEFAEIRDYAENADGAGKCGGIGQNGIGGTGKVISPGCCIVTHRNNNRFFVTGQFDFAQDNIRSQGAASG
ncbi:hypothetical protein DSECCO2_246990 [anaerobic digester metagenome]